MADITPGLRYKMQATFFIVFISILIVTSVLTLLSVFFGLGQLTPEQQNTFVNISIGESIAACVGLFYFIFGIQGVQKKQNSENNGLTQFDITVGLPQKNTSDASVKMSSIAPLQTIEHCFLHVLLSKFSLRRTARGIIFETNFEDEIPAIWSRQGKIELEEQIFGNQPAKVTRYQNELDQFLIGSQGDLYSFNDPQFFFRYVSGGTLPIVEIKGIEYYCLFFREISPIGWNIANGGSDCREELLDPVKIIMRELNEELIIIDRDKKRRYTFGNSPEMPEFILVRELIKCLFTDLEWDELKIFEPEITWNKGPDELKVRIGKGAQRSTPHCYVNINATDLGIEIDQIAKFKVDETAIFIDGELCDGVAPGYHVVNAPIGLFNVERVNEQVKKDYTKYEPDLFFWNGKKYEGKKIEEVIREKFIPSLAMAMSKKEIEYFNSRGDLFMNLCPVTKNIIGRYIKQL